MNGKINLNCWMSALSDGLKLTQINMPGTHDSTACYATFSLISKTQSLTVAGQLNAGVRFFDFRFSLVNGVFKAMHGIARCKKGRCLFAANLTADDVVADCVEFVKSNPSETVLFMLRDTTGSKDFFSEFYSRYIQTNPQLWYLENRIPLLGEVRGKIVLLRSVDTNNTIFNDTNSGIDFRTPYIGSRFVDDWKTGDIRSLETGESYAKIFVQDSYKVEGRKKWGTVKRFLEQPLDCDNFNLCLTSCTGLKCPYINAKIINKKLMDFDFCKGRVYGIISMDFISALHCQRIIATNSDVC